MKKIKKDPYKLIEDLIKKMDYPTKKELWEALNKKISHEEVSKIVDGLVESNKILIDKDGRIIWVYNPKLSKIIKEEGLEFF